MSVVTFKVEYIRGTATVQRSGQSNNIHVEMELRVNDIITTRNDSEVRIRVYKDNEPMCPIPIGSNQTRTLKLPTSEPGLVVNASGGCSARFTVAREKQTYLIIYGSGWVSPISRGQGGDSNDSFRLLAEARHKINKEKHPYENCVEPIFCPTDIEFFNAINNNENIVRLDVYSHGFEEGLNLGGFIGERVINGTKLSFFEDDSNFNCNKDANGNLNCHVVWWIDDSGGRDLRRVDIRKNGYFQDTNASDELKNLDITFQRNGNDELVNLNPNKFADRTKVYFWGCNIGGQLTLGKKHVLNVDDTNSNPKDSFAQKFAERIGKGNVYALLGRVAPKEHGGSVFKKDQRGRIYYADGEMLPANVANNCRDGVTWNIDAYKHMKEFPL